MKVREIMSSGIITAGPDTTFQELWKLIIKRRINALPIVDKKKQLIGLVTKDDLLGALYPNFQQYLEELTTISDFEAMEDKVRDVAGKRAKSVMCKRVIYTREETPIMRALSRMIVRRVNQLPVLADKNGDIVVGMVTKGDIFSALFRKELRKKKRD